MSHPFQDVLLALYGGAKRPDDDAGQLRALADWLDRVDDEMDKQTINPPYKVERTMQADLRRIADTYEHADRETW